MKEVPLAGGRVALVDDEDYEQVRDYAWRVAAGQRGPGYALAHTREGRIARRYVYMHRLILQAPVGIQVDHINGNSLDNRRCNLRLVSHKQNGENKPVARNNKSGVRNVFWIEWWQRYLVQVRVGGKLIGYGSYRSLEEAAAVAERARKEHFPYSEEARCVRPEVARHKKQGPEGGE